MCSSRSQTTGEWSFLGYDVRKGILLCRAETMQLGQDRWRKVLHRTSPPEVSLNLILWGLWSAMYPGFWSPDLSASFSLLLWWIWQFFQGCSASISRLKPFIVDRNEWFLYINPYIEGILSPDLGILQYCFVYGKVVDISHWASGAAPLVYLASCTSIVLDGLWVCCQLQMWWLCTWCSTVLWVCGP